MFFRLSLLVSTLSISPARADDGGVVTRIISSLGSEIDLFADCDRSQKKPLLLAATGGTVRQVSLKCRDGAGKFDVYLSYQSKAGEPKKDFLKEAFFRATNPEAEPMLLAATDKVAEGGGEVELAFAKYRAVDAVIELTLSLQGFSWDLLSGATYHEKLKTQSERQSSVDVTDAIALKVPEMGKVEAAVTTFNMGWSVVHLILDDGRAMRFPVRLPATANGQPPTLSAFPISADEAALKYQGASESAFYRVDPPAKKLEKLGLVERSNVTKDTETRHALMPALKTEGPYHAFDLVRVEVKRDASGNVRGTSEKVIGRCSYDAVRRDFVCPKI